MSEPALVVGLQLGAVSLHSRARTRDAAASPSQTLGVAIESTETAMPSLSMASIAWLGCHFISRS